MNFTKLFQGDIGNGVLRNTSALIASADCPSSSPARLALFFYRHEISEFLESLRDIIDFYTGKPASWGCERLSISFPRAISLSIRVCVCVFARKKAGKIAAGVIYPARTSIRKEGRNFFFSLSLQLGRNSPHTREVCLLCI